MRHLHFFFLLLLLPLGLRAQVLQGPWSGQLNLGAQQLGIIFRFTESEGSLSCTMDVPMQSLKGFRMKVAEASDTLLELQAPSLMASFRGKRIAPDRIEGIWAQSGMFLPLVLRPGEPGGPLRPQDPVPPVDYPWQNVIFWNTEEDFALAGTLALPKGTVPGKEVPVVLLVSGSGPQNRDGEIFAHRPFLIISDYLAQHGIASLRYDDRGVAASSGDPRKCTSVDFTEDARAGIRFLRDTMGFERVGVIGHSEGGLIAFRLAAEGEVDFMVSLAGPGIKGDTLLTEQMNAMNRLAGVPSQLSVKQVRAQLASQLKNPWMEWFLDHDPSETIASVRVPVLALNGEKDAQVLPASNLTAIRTLLRKGHPKNVFREYPGLNHLFQHCTTGAGTEYYQIDETFSEEVLRDISEWIHGLAE